MSYSFPLLKANEIAQCLNELSIPFTEENLQKPNAENIRVVYENFIEMLMGITREEIQQPHFVALDAFEYPELHDESVAELNAHRALLRLMSTAGIMDFSIRDLQKPEPSRVIKILSALINFAKFREERLQAYHELTAKMEAYVEQKQQLDDRNRDLEGQIRKIKAQRQADEPAVEAITKETNALGVEITALHKEAASLQADVKAVKQALNDIAESIAHTNLAFANAKQENARYKSQIVQSPDRLKRLLRDLEDSFDSEKQGASDMEKRSRELQARSEALSKIEKSVQKCVKFMDECEQELKRAKEKSKLRKETQSAVQHSEAKLEDLCTREQHLLRQVNNVQDKLARFSSYQDQKREAALKALEGARAERLVMEQTRSATQATLEANAQLIKQLENNIASLTKQHENDLQRLKEKYSQLETSVIEYHRQLLDTTGSSEQDGA